MHIKCSFAPHLQPYQIVPLHVIVAQSLATYRKSLTGASAALSLHFKALPGNSHPGLTVVIL